MTFLRTYRWEIGLALITLCSHLILFFLVLYVNGGNIFDTVHGDDGYYEIAKNLLAGNGFSMSTSAPFIPNALRTPGYVYFLVGLLATVGYTGAAIIQLILSTVIPVLGMHIARRITGSLRVGIAAGIILALDPTLALLSFNFLTDTLFVTLFFAWTLLFFRYLERPHLLTLAASSLVLGLAIITRPTVQYIPLIVIPFILWQLGRAEWRRGVVHVFVSLAIVGAILTPWIIRNYYEFGAPGLSSQRALVLYTNFPPAVLSIANGSQYAAEAAKFTAVATPANSIINPLSADSYTREAVEIARAHPTATAYVALKSLYTFFANDGVYPVLVALGHAPYDFLWLLIPARLVWLAITVAAFVGALVYLLTRRSALAILIILLVAYFALTSIIAAFGTNPRYRLPVDPIILALAAVGGMYLIRSCRRIPRGLPRG